MTQSTEQDAAAKLHEIQEREREFWNAKGKQDLEALDPETYRVTPDALHDPAMPWLPYMGVTNLIKKLFDVLGDVKGKRILDIGAGTGFLSVALALRGAHVVSTDIAEQPLEVARFRAKVSNAPDTIEFKRVASESLEFPDQSFDAVTGLFILHHLELDSAAAEIKRVLKPGGKGAFVETSGQNPVLTFARKFRGKYGVEKAGSDDELPLNAEKIAKLRSVFGEGLRLHYPDLIFLRMCAANLPIGRIPPIKWGLKVADNAMYYVPLMNRWSYFVTVELQRQGA